MCKLVDIGHGDYQLHLEPDELKAVCFFAATWEKPTADLLEMFLTERLNFWSRFIQMNSKTLEGPG